MQNFLTAVILAELYGGGVLPAKDVSEHAKAASQPASQLAMICCLQ